MQRERLTSILVGCLFILGTVAGVISAVISSPLLSADDYMVQVAGDPSKLIFAGMCVLIMGFALAFIPVLMYPILRERNPVLAQGYVLFRGALETAMYILIFLAWLMLISVSRDFMASGMPADAWHHTLSTVLADTDVYLANVLKLVFPIGALLYNAALYRIRLVPRWLSAWGFIGAALHMIEGVLGLFNVLPEVVVPFLTLPIALQEMVYALWLIVKGFNKSIGEK